MQPAAAYPAQRITYRYRLKWWQQRLLREQLDDITHGIEELK